MIRFIRVVIYSIAAAIAAPFFLDWLDQSRQPVNSSRRLRDGKMDENAIDKLGDDERKAMLDELAAQV